VSGPAYRFIARLYPRRWRERYGDELCDLCEELARTGQTTRARLGLAIVVGAAAERLRLLRSRRGRAMAAGSMVVIIGLCTATLATATLASGGRGLLGAGHAAARPAAIRTSPGASAPPNNMPSPGLFHLGRGYAEATSSVQEPSGVMVRARLSAPRGARAYAEAVLLSGGTAQVEISTARNAADPWVSCQLHGDVNDCTEAFFWCPMPSATWQLTVVKQSGPAGPVRLDLYVGPKNPA
jgi:hypothetical protein